MTYNEDTRELTITLPDGEWYRRGDLVQALAALEQMTLEKRSEFIVYMRIDQHTGRRAQVLSPEMSLYIAHILKHDVSARLYKNPFDMLEDPSYAKKVVKALSKLNEEIEKIESKRNIYGDNYDPDEDEDL